jgi:3-methyladenine DNA glycosylase AlkD
MNTNSQIPKIRQDLEKNIDDKTRSTTQHFFKEKIRFYGVKTAIVSKIGKEYYKLIKDRKKEEIFKLCDELWQSGYIEESIIACNWSYYIHKDYEPGDLIIFKKWIESYVNNWASCDTLCNHSLGEFLEKFPEFITELKGWAKSQNRWMRRASAVSLILPARKGKFLKDIFEISDILLTDKDDLVQKGYGWMLKAASQAHQKEVFEYVVEKKNMMPRTALRYAIEKMPQDLKKTAMEK